MTSEARNRRGREGFWLRSLGQAGREGAYGCDAECRAPVAPFPGRNTAMGTCGEEILSLAEPNDR